MKYDPKNILIVSFLNHEESKAQEFLDIFQKIIDDDGGCNHLILLRKNGTIGFSFSFPFEALEKYPALLKPYQPERANGLPHFCTPVLGKEHLEYWRQMFDLDQTFY
jgi:hypothetical protein